MQMASMSVEKANRAREWLMMVSGGLSTIKTRGANGSWYTCDLCIGRLRDSSSWVGTRIKEGCLAPLQIQLQLTPGDLVKFVVGVNCCYSHYM